MYLIGYNHYHSLPPWNVDALVTRLDMPGQPVHRLLASLVDAGYLIEVPGEGTPAYLPMHDIESMRLAELLAAVRQSGESRFLNTRQLPGIAPVDELVDHMATTIIDDPAYTRTVREMDQQSGEWIDKELTDEPFKPGDKVIAFVNSMGGTPVSELYAAYGKLDEVCKTKDITIVRNLIGPYITSLEMQGFSITLLKVDDEILKFWDAPAKTPGLRWGV